MSVEEIARLLTITIESMRLHPTMAPPDASGMGAALFSELLEMCAHARFMLIDACVRCRMTDVRCRMHAYGWPHAARRLGGRGCTHPNAPYLLGVFSRILTRLTWTCAGDACTSNDPGDAGTMLGFDDPQCYPFLGSDGEPVPAFVNALMMQYLMSPNYPGGFPNPFIINDQLPWHDGAKNEVNARGDTLKAPKHLAELIECAAFLR
jgi:hypothetical protein